MTKFRVLIAQGEMDEALAVKPEFNASNPSYHQIVRNVTDQRFELLLATRSTSPTLGRTFTFREFAHREAKGSEIPPEVISALPKKGNKSLCMKYLANTTRRGRGTLAFP